MRLIFKHGEVCRKIASINIVNHDGSINLALVRFGSNMSGWQSNASDYACIPVEFASPEPKTIKITIHTSGRINYHLQPNPSVNFIPCLLDLTEAVPIAGYLIPSVTLLDLANEIRNDDHFFKLDVNSAESCSIEFYAIPSNLPHMPNEVWRCIVENRYGLACKLIFYNPPPVIIGVPPNAFTLSIPPTLLAQQVVAEDQAFSRFQKLRLENHIRSVLTSSTIPVSEHEKIIEEKVRYGQGIRGPNKEGIWEIVCSAPMNTQPKLAVQFSDPRYRSEIKDMDSIDRRLDKVRVRFRVYDTQENKWVKHSVEITNASLDARL